jgi:cytochrome P450
VSQPSVASSPGQTDVPIGVFIDTYSDEYDSDVHTAHRNAREIAWYATTPAGVMALRHAEVNELLRDRRLGEMREYALESMGITEGPLWEWWRLMLFSQGGEGHSRLRRLVSKAFTPRKVELMRPAISEIAQRLIDGLDGRDSCEFVSEFAAPFAVSVIGHLLGIDESEHDRFYAASNDLALAFTGQIAQERPRIERGLAVLQAYADELIAKRRQHPVGDLVSDLIAAEEQGDRLSEAEVQMLITILIFGGLDTTQCQFACAIATFARHPDQWRLLAERSDLASLAAEEILRYEPAGAGAPRRVEESFDFQGLHFEEGDTVFPSSMAANRDPRAFETPEVFDITRSRNTTQLTFGGGLHYCLGAALARAELEEALPLLARRLSNLAVAGDVQWRKLATIRGPEVLPISYELRP